MMRKERIRSIYLLISCLSLSILLIACTAKEAPYLPEKLMQDVLRELHFADVIAEANGGSIGWRHAIRSEHYDEILDNFKISRAEFYRSYTHYLNNPVIMDSIYVRLVKDIEDRMEGVRMDDYDMRKDKKKWDKLKENMRDSLRSDKNAKANKRANDQDS